MLTIDLFGRPPRGVTADLIRKLAAATFKQAGGFGNVHVSFSIVDDQIMKGLNLRHRGVKKTTDVLSFTYGTGEDNWPETDNDTSRRLLGEIVISGPQVSRQAKEIGRTIADEFLIMVVHGVLHLMDYDHVMKRQEDEMFSLQHKILMSQRIIFHP
ncbi:rRNA maturation RNase YbeY [Candidatus Uhrbacteria bacterium RIFOXYC2_FULL_47_19]|uniref:Endoribonuclease YbeY n=1 Tax=Candidatus Uhrbacteria bacterium RIFOXYC2_FULL_47_19 TaxID=1802424 RepID=A0A1F7WGQ9_9BACT|nr:MAG: rRNA maturation RNase YbeY [Candidatus Uhrbacteria bacterium RIFOXYC2_FULL_47_19]HCC22151.1 rRNA maturation RNase YbeY [Candidatus Uhrbacteria bacterium]